MDRWELRLLQSARHCWNRCRNRATARGEETVIAEPNARGKPPSGESTDWSFGHYALFAALFAGVCLIVYEPALDGPFVSDDNHYVKNNIYIHELSVENLLSILNPVGAATLTIVNYSPTQLLIHTFAWTAFSDEVFGHHVVNVGFHVLASLLLVSLLCRRGVPPVAALLGGAFFALHPANVEAVAWISQLKTGSGLVLSLAALLAFPKRPGLGTAFFIAAMLAKANAAYALPVAALFAWTDRGNYPWKWLSVWAVAFALFSVAEFWVHQRSGAAEAILHDTPWVLLRTMMGLAARYLVMSATSWGVSAFHEPEPAYEITDPWFLASLFALGLLGWRTIVVGRRRETEFVFWIWALVSFAPVSQIFPFLYPLADRYLYFILPGLIGGALLAGREVLDRVLTAQPSWDRASVLKALAATGVALLVPFAAHSYARAGVWRSPTMLLADAARHYPDGVSANLLRAKRAAQVGDVDTAVAALRIVAERGFNRFDQLNRDPSLAPIKNHPKFKAVIADIALAWIESIDDREAPTQGELRAVARAHVIRGDYRAASDALLRALEIDGPMDEQLRRDLENIAARPLPGDGRGL